MTFARTLNRPVDSHVMCLTQPSRALSPGEVRVVLSDERVLTSQETFTYVPNPIIESIDRLTAFASGGVNVTVTGMSLMS